MGKRRRVGRAEGGPRRARRAGLLVSFPGGVAGWAREMNFLAARRCQSCCWGSSFPRPLGHPFLGEVFPQSLVAGGGATRKSGRQPLRASLAGDGRRRAVGGGGRWRGARPGPFLCRAKFVSRWPESD